MIASFYIAHACAEADEALAEREPCACALAGAEAHEGIHRHGNRIGGKITRKCQHISQHISHDGFCIEQHGQGLKRVDLGSQPRRHELAVNDIERFGGFDELDAGIGGAVALGEDALHLGALACPPMRDA